MTDRIATVLVDVRVQALEIVLEDAFITFQVSVELIGVGMSTREGVAWIERARGLVHLQEGSDGGIGNTSTGPLTFPDRSDDVTLLAKKAMFFFTWGKDIIHGTTEESGMRFVAENRSGNRARNTRRIRRRSESSHRICRRCNVGRAAVAPYPHCAHVE